MDDSEDEWPQHDEADWLDEEDEGQDFPLPPSPSELEQNAADAPDDTAPKPVGWVASEVRRIEKRTVHEPARTAATVAAEVAALWQRSLTKRVTDDTGHRLQGGAIPPEHKWARAHPDHRLRVTNTVIFCRHCGKWGAWKLTKLRAPCTDPAKGSTNTTRRRLLRGEAPVKGQSWPGGAHHSSVWQVARVTVATPTDEDTGSESELSAS